MATTPAKTRRRASAPTAPTVAPDANTAPATPVLSDATVAAPATRPARKAAAKTTKAAVKTPAAPATKTARKPAAKRAAPAAVTPAEVATPAPAPVAEAAPEAVVAPARKKAATQPATKKVAAKKVAAKKSAAKKTPARKPAAAPAPAVIEAVAPVVEAEAETPASTADAAPRKTPARKRSRPAAAAPAPVIEPLADETTEAPATPELPADQASDAAIATAEAAAPAAAEGAADDAERAEEPSDAEAEPAAASDTAAEAPATRERSRRNRNRHRGRDKGRERSADAPTDHPAAARAAPDIEGADDLEDADSVAAEPLAPVEAPQALQAEPAAPVAPPPPARPRRPAPSGPAHSTLQCLEGDQRLIVWHTGHAASDALYRAAEERLGADGRLADADDDTVPRLLRLAAEEGHRVDIDAAVWAQLAARRDARTRAGVLMAAYPDGPASPALRGLLTVPLPLYQAEGALWAVVAGRGLLADERGLGKSVQAIAAAQLWRQHFGLRRVAVISGAGERLAWQRAWRRFAGIEAQVMEGGLHQRQAAWSQDAEVRVLAPEALGSDAAHLAHWGPELVIVDEPQRLALDADDWAVLDQAPQALVLCGAPLDDQPALLEQLVAWLDRDRLGAYAALREVRAAREGRALLGDDDVERVTDALSRSVLQRQRSEVAEQLPPLVYSERIVPLAPAQREAHDRQMAALHRGLSGWLASGYLSDTDQWRLATTLRAALAACHRADPAVEASPLADAVVQAVADQLQAWAPGAEAAAPLQVALLCDTDADAAQLGAVLEARGLARPGIELLANGQPVSVAPDAVLQVGVPWRARRAALLPPGAKADASVVPGQQWLLLVAQDSLEAALFDTLGARTDVPRSAAEPGGRGFLQGERLLAWLQAVSLALQAMPAAPPPVGSGA